MVDIQITGVRYDISDKLKDFIDEKFGSLNKFHGSLHRVQITIHEAPNHGFRVDADMHLPNHHDLAAHAMGETVYAAIDRLKDKATAQLHKVHDKEATKNKREISDRMRRMPA